MARRPRKSGLEHLLEALSQLPWRVSVMLAPIAWLGFRWLAQIEPPQVLDAGQMGSMVVVTVLKTAGLLLQYLAPVSLLLAALASWLRKRRRTNLLVDAESRSNSAPLRNLSWREFEQLVGAHFERLGYSVSFTAAGADGGVDVEARKGAEIFLIQCKQWRATRVGVSVVRELFGVVAARGATGGFVVSIGPFTADAQAFAEGCNIELMDARALLVSLASHPPMTTPVVQTIPASQAPACPRCGSAMVRRIAKQGGRKGTAFLGCTSYPKCNGTLETD